MTRRGPDDFAADMAARKQAEGVTLAALNTPRIAQEREVSGAGSNVPTIDEAVLEINELLNQADATRLDAGRKFLALRARVEAGEVGSGAKWWEFYGKHFTRSRKDAEKLMRLAQSDDPEAAIEAEKRAQKIRNNRKPRLGAVTAPSTAAELIHERQLRIVEQHANFGCGDGTGRPDGGSEGGCATGGPNDPGRGDPDGHDDQDALGDPASVIEDANGAEKEKPSTAADQPAVVGVLVTDERSQTIAEIWEAAHALDRARIENLVLYEFFKVPNPAQLHMRLGQDRIDTIVKAITCGCAARDEVWRLVCKLVHELTDARREELRKRLDRDAERPRKRHNRLNRKPPTINLPATRVSGADAGDPECP